MGKRVLHGADFSSTHKKCLNAETNCVCLKADMYLSARLIADLFIDSESG